MDCIFCRIVARDAPALVVFEDDLVVSFLALRPEVVGHTILVPKAHHDDLCALPDALLHALARASRRHAIRWRDDVGVTGINLLHASGVDAQQSVRHVHVHLLPRFSNDGVDAWPTLPGSTEPREVQHARFRIT